MDVGSFGGGDDLVGGDFSVVVAVRDIVGDGAVEQHWLLLHHAQLPPEARQREARASVAVVQLLKRGS